MDFNFTGEVSAVRVRQLEYISEVLQERGYKNCEVAIEPVGLAGDNYIANVKRIVVKQNGDTFKLIAKLAPEVRDFMDASVLFENEHIIYTELFPKFRELQKNAGIPQEEWFRHAECYGTFMEKPNEVILLEDLKHSNFNISNRFKPLSIESTKLVLKNFAIYHSLSYVLKNKNHEKFSEISSNIRDFYLGPPELMEIRRKFGTKMENEIIEKLRDERYKDVFRGTMSDFETLLEIANQDKGAKHSIIQQGDGWTNNIMFSYENNEISKCILIDYQMSKESSPAYDIMYMIFNSTDTEERIQYYTELIDYYYNELDNYLKKHGLRAGDVLPRSQLDADMKKYAKLIVCISIIVINLIIKSTAESSKIKEKMDNSELLTEDAMELLMERSAETEILFAKRIEGLARSFIELGLM